jgi:hypothetical protein
MSPLPMRSVKQTNKGTDRTRYSLGSRNNMRCPKAAPQSQTHTHALGLMICTIESKDSLPCLLLLSHTVLS